jgi:transposase-like protein
VPVLSVKRSWVGSGAAFEDGYRESTESRAAVMHDLKDRGLNELKFVIGDGAPPTWAAAARRVPNARRQACCLLAIAKVLDALPERLQRRAKTLLHELIEAPSRADARQALERFR